MNKAQKLSDPEGYAPFSDSAESNYCYSLFNDAINTSDYSVEQLND
jgi:hypothetical protein